MRVAVEIVAEEATITGHVFLNPNERIIDMMNDARQYIAFEHGDGTFEVLSKRLIRRLRPVDQSRPDQRHTLPLMPGT
jgi:membrane-associated protease RseP (regulator of RpoE activity)